MLLVRLQGQIVLSQLLHVPGGHCWACASLNILGDLTNMALQRGHACHSQATRVHMADMNTLFLLMMLSIQLLLLPSLLLSALPSLLLFLVGAFLCCRGVGTWLQ